MTETGTAKAPQYQYFTKARNYLFDSIIPEVTRLCKQGKTAALILFQIERETAGFHQLSAEVSVPDMENFTSASRSDVRRARSWLITHGYIEILSGGNGLETSELRIIIDPHERKIGLKPVDKPAKIISLPMESTSPPPTITLPDPSFRVDPSSESTQTVNAKDNITPPGEEAPQSTDSEAVEAPDPTPAVVPDPTPETSRVLQYESAVKSNEVKRVLTDPPSRELYGLNSTGEETEGKETNMETGTETEQEKAAFGSVCFFCHSESFKMESRDYAFAKWAVLTYGAEVVVSKIQIAKFQTVRGIKLANPLGWLRNALARNYQPAKFDGEVLKAREMSRLQTERADRERVQTDRDKQEWRGYREQNPDAGKQAYAAFLKLTEN